MKRFDTELCGETHVAQPLRSCDGIERRLKDVRDTVAREYREHLDVSSRLFHLALNEAEALAWQTGFPHLFFPTLAAEKAQAAVNWQKRQQALNSRGDELVLAE